MINRFLKETICLLFVVAFVVAGCERKYESDVDVLAYGPDVNMIVVTNDYTPRAIGATGGYQAWIKTEKLQVDGVVTFYKADGSFYLTEHHCAIYPWSDSIRISALEPQGKLVWQLSQDSFSVIEAPHEIDVLPMAIAGRDFAEAILDIITAPVHLLDSKVVFTKEPKPVKMGGLWYYPIEWKSRDIEAYVELHWSKVIFYQNRDSSLVDMIWFAGVEQGKFLAVRGYDYRKVKENGILVPTRIEIFKTDVRGVLQEQLVKIDYYSLKSVE